MKLTKNEAMKQLEEMGLFFKNRVDGYDAHMLTEIEGADAFYPFMASLLPATPQAAVLDLGCGTGLELAPYFARNPDARVMGIDLSPDMLAALSAKFPERRLKLVQGSYFDAEFGVGVFDAAVSAESLHHFPARQKLALYRKLYAALKPGGYFVLTDCFAASEEAEAANFAELERLKAEQGVADGAFYHYDTPLTTEHEISILKEAGFSRVTLLKQWGATGTILAET